eukprot:TRINITY_DN15381_c0_g1_i1.p1 TRINITY_DN15381_c0_g1~~TRINITY_DN15381_c0_g1_i1.p1  ORF type:complete len:316 (-),score=49.48 TRINITY_DN15381_c0_g1_i1:24-836(-)
MAHNGITLEADGGVQLQLSSKNVGLFEAFASAAKPIQLVHCTFELAKPGKLPAGVTELPFEFPLEALDGGQLFETYHGVFVNVQYAIGVEVMRPLLAKNLSKTVEFIVELPGDSERAKEEAVPFTVTPEALENVRQTSRAQVPKFKITGKLTSALCCITRPITGEVVVEECNAPIASIELQLVRVETCGSADGFAREATEIQNIQLAEGDVCRNLVIPIYMVFPRLFTCPSVAAKTFRVEFEVNLVVVFQDNHLITENFPIKLYRVTAKK